MGDFRNGTCVAFLKFDELKRPSTYLGSTRTLCFVWICFFFLNVWGSWLWVVYVDTRDWFVSGPVYFDVPAASAGGSSGSRGFGVKDAGLSVGLSLQGNIGMVTEGVSYLTARVCNYDGEKANIILLPLPLPLRRQRQLASPPPSGTAPRPASRRTGASPFPRPPRPRAT